MNCGMSPLSHLTVGGVHLGGGGQLIVSQSRLLVGQVHLVLHGVYAVVGALQFTSSLFLGAWFLVSSSFTIPALCSLSTYPIFSVE